MKKIVVGILAHVDSGKTTLSEAMLYCSGNINKLGRVDHRNSFLDTFSLERERGITIFSKQAILKYQQTEFTVLDTPGHIDFSAETERTLQVLDYAILVISGTDGIQNHTLTLWKLLKKYHVPCFIFVNKMDLQGANRDDIMLQLQSRLSEYCIHFSTDQTDEFYESIAVCDETLLNEYDQKSTIEKNTIIQAIKNRKIFPCIFGSALKLEGIDEFLKCFDDYTTMPEYNKDFAAKIFKISEDKQRKRLTFLKVTGGCLKVREVLKSDKNTGSEKVSQIRIYSGEKFVSVDKAEAGTICAVTGITFAVPGDGLGAEQNSDAPVLEPVLTYSLELPKQIDAHQAFEKMKILESEDPQLHILWNEYSGNIQCRVMGEIQLEVLKCIIAERFGFEVNFGTGSIIYKETITKPIEGVGHFEPLRHYAEVHLLLKPAKRNSGIVFKTDCREEVLDKNWQNLILSQLNEKTHIGVLTGSPVTDMEIIVVSGKAHTKHTEGGDFRQAAYRAVRQGLRSTDSILLEPYYEFILEIPTENIGRAISDIQRMSGNFEQPQTKNDITVITGTAPVSTMSNYSKEVTQYSHGKGKLTCSFKGYETCHNAEEVIAGIGYDPDRDIDNPCDSVFCSHGAGYIVKWNDVKKHMHVADTFSEVVEKDYVTTNENTFLKYQSSKELFSLDKELMQIFEQTYGPVKRKKVIESKEYIASNYTKKTKATNKKYDGTEYLLVDGYNVIFSWDSLKKLAAENIDAARTALTNILCNYQGYRKCKLILVFDAYKVKGGTEKIEKEGDISIVYTKEAETADMYIEKVTHKLAKNNKVRVVTSDGLEQIIILGNGALRISSQAFYNEIRGIETEIRTIIDRN